ncbi:MAG TPA: hypothetical protein VEA80_05260 [Vitreimonas sp.]|uniref:hypothetical protein n=1 Tax=Vitreimonas sp. TaxID=3069702 RepID=UPI002D6BE428|nr:hypothetical protein [Vitreimonas sp.]HYD86861.1 hypothetical protein [Vitreimonas sp.]
MFGVRGFIAGFFLTALAAFPASAQHPLFSDDAEVQIVLEAPLNTLIRNADRSTDAVPAVATITAPGAQAERFDIQLSPRGFSRRTGGICTFPPLRLDFDATRGTSMRGQNRLKLVTRCRNGANYEQLTVLEYTAYRLYNEITPLSFRVRPVRVTYRDTEGRRREETQFNFLVEDLDDVARRNNEMAALEVLSNEVRSSQLHTETAAVYGLFQYMIGNLDWDMVSGHAGDECCHNSKLVGATAESRENVIPIPYDFDYSGFVNAPYAIPPEGLGVANVRTRYYRGLCRHNEQVPAAAERIRARRSALYAVIDGEPRLNANNRRNARRYLDEFFAILDDPQRVQRQIIDRCRR